MSSKLHVFLNFLEGSVSNFYFSVTAKKQQLHGLHYISPVTKKTTEAFHWLELITLILNIPTKKYIHLLFLIF